MRNVHYKKLPKWNQSFTFFKLSFLWLLLRYIAASLIRASDWFELLMITAFLLIMRRVENIYKNIVWRNHSNRVWLIKMGVNVYVSYVVVREASFNECDVRLMNQINELMSNIGRLHWHYRHIYKTKQDGSMNKISFSCPLNKTSSH